MTPFRERPGATQLQCKDFRAPLVEGRGAFSEAKLQPLAQAISAANDWIRDSGVTVVNVETVVLPNLSLLDDTQASDASVLHVDQTVSWYQIVRVWFETPG